MTDQEILELAIDKANAKGMRHSKWSTHPSKWLGSTCHPYEILYNHDFAKALWPGDVSGGGFNIRSMSYESVSEESWKYHLSNMAVAEDPIKYLEANI